MLFFFSFKEALQVCPQKKKKRKCHTKPFKEVSQVCLENKSVKRNVSKLVSPPLIITDPQFYDFIPTYENSRNNKK
jgi:hypothetical protein